MILCLLWHNDILCWSCMSCVCCYVSINYSILYQANKVYRQFLLWSQHTALENPALVRGAMCSSKHAHLSLRKYIKYAQQCYYFFV